jgi:hypothetical protein
MVFTDYSSTEYSYEVVSSTSYIGVDNMRDDSQNFDGEKSVTVTTSKNREVKK